MCSSGTLWCVASSLPCANQSHTLTTASPHFWLGYGVPAHCGLNRRAECLLFCSTWPYLHYYSWFFIGFSEVDPQANTSTSLTEHCCCAAALYCDSCCDGCIQVSEIPARTVRLHAPSLQYQYAVPQAPDLQSSCAGHFRGGIFAPSGAVLAHRVVCFSLPSSTAQLLSLTTALSTATISGVISWRYCKRAPSIVLRQL